MLYSKLLFTSVKSAVEGNGVRLGLALTEHQVSREKSSDITGLLFLTFQALQSEALLSTVMTIKKDLLLNWRQQATNQTIRLTAP